MLFAVVVWSYLLGGVLYREESLSWSGPILPHQIPGERRETEETSQYSLLTRNVNVSSGGFRGGKGGAVAPPLADFYAYMT